MTEKSPKETVIYGGAFNPPTRAHQAILQGCIDYAESRGADVWLLPSASRHDKTIIETYERRLEYCEALASDVAQRTVKVSILTTELDRAQPTETYDTVQEMAAGYPGRRFVWVFGADSVATMRQWNHGDWLYENLDLLVVERPGFEVAELGPRAVRLAVETAELSSTELRRRIACDEPYEDMVGQAVRQLLVQPS